MKSCNTMHRRGFTLLETMVATFIVLLALGLAMTGFLYAVRSQNFTDVQNELDIDSQIAIEHLKRDLRLSTLSEILYYPQSAASYSAVSFPLAYDDDGDGSVETDENSKIIWDETVIYHMFMNNPNPSELRVTRFRPRSQTATQAQRQTQLNNVVARSNGKLDCLSDEQTTTDTLFVNLFNWNIRPRAATFDGYAPTYESTPMIDLGSYVLSGGTHYYKFVVVGKNAASSGYYMGLDTLKMTPCSMAREAEAFTTATSGSLRREEIGGNLAWSGNQHLFFGGVATNASFMLSILNDRWEESKFYDAAAVQNETTVFYGTNLPGTVQRKFALKLAGMDTNWTAAAQSNDSEGSPVSGTNYAGAAVRVLMRGADMAEGGWFTASGGKCVVAVRAGAGALTIDKLWIAEAASNETAAMDAKAGTMTQLKFFGADNKNVPAGSTAETDEWGAFTIEKQKSYLVTMLIKDDPAQANPHIWTDSGGAASPCSYVIPGVYDPDDTTAKADNWSALPTNYPVFARNFVIGVDHIRATYAPSGTYVSAVCSTGLPDPQYTAWSLTQCNPGVGSIEMRVRSGTALDMSDAGDWSAAPVVASGVTNGSLVLLPAKPHVQFMLTLKPSADSLQTPIIGDVKLTWNGQTKITDIGGRFTRGPNYGIWEVLIDGNRLKSGIQIELELYRDVRGFTKPLGQQRITSFVQTEVMPRNTGK